MNTDKLSEGVFAFLLNFPTIILVILILIFPLGYSLYISFTNVDLFNITTGDISFIGLNNFLEVASDPLFLQSLLHTVIFSAIAVIGMMAMGLVIGLVITRSHIPMSNFTKAIMLLPWAVPPAANGLLWRFIYNPNYGYANQILLKLGIINDPIQFLNNPNLALPAVAIPYIWRAMPFSILIFYSALQGLPKALYDSAKVDGAGAFKQFIHVTLPLLKPAIFVILVLRTAFAFAVFDEVFTMTQGGPGNSTWLAAWYTYTFTFRHTKFGFGAASAWLITLCIGLLAIFYVKYLYSEVEY